MGRRYKATQLKLVEGRRDRRSLNLQQTEPMPKGDLVEPPEWLSDDQKAGWNYVMEHAPGGLLKMLDRGVVTSWVVSESLYKEAVLKLANSPMVLRTPQGAIVQSPYLSILNRQAVIMKGLAAELGFSPAARTQISCENGSEPEDPAERYFR